MQTATFPMATTAGVTVVKIYNKLISSFMVKIQSVHETCRKCEEEKNWAQLHTHPHLHTSATRCDNKDHRFTICLTAAVCMKI